MIDIRPATPHDAHDLAELRWEFRTGRAPAAEEHDAFIRRCAEWMRRELAAESWRAWVAVAEGRIVGHVWLGTIAKIPNPVVEQERHGYISNVYVTPDVRGGVGTRLLRTALAWARENGVDRVILWPTARSATLYARHGFARNLDVMELAL
jgi:GNAT superfamily N-acetyltransferase